MFSVSNTLRPSKITVCINADGAVVRTAMQSAWGSRFKFEHNPSIILYFANWDILRYTEINQQYREMIMVYWEINIIDVEIIIIFINTLIYWDILSSTWYIKVYLGICVVQLVYFSMKSYPELCYETVATQPRLVNMAPVIPRCPGGQLSRENEVKHGKTRSWGYSSNWRIA